MAVLCFAAAEAEGLVDIKVTDWSNEVAPFWAEVSCRGQQQHKRIAAHQIANIMQQSAVLTAQAAAVDAEHCTALSALAACCQLCSDVVRLSM
jgi:hypothetical protein